MELLKVQPTRLRKLGLDEKWLQDRIDDDPSLLGLGELTVIRRERRQLGGGRLDFLMADPDEGLRYEIEVMLGTLDESHIIRTIEYWDVERRRFPTLDHRAVIVAEDITNRFFNVINLLNHAIPIIALQLAAFEIEGSVMLHFTRVLDVTESGDEDEEATEQTDRAYWEKRANPKSLQISDALVKLVPTESGGPRITYNKSHIAIGTPRRNFMWLHPRQKRPHCSVHLRLSEDERDAAVQRLDELGVTATLRRKSNIGLRLSEKDVEDVRAELGDLIRRAEDLSRE